MLKRFLVIFALVGVLAGCSKDDSSNNTAGSNLGSSANTPLLEPTANSHNGSNAPAGNNAPTANNTPGPSTTTGQGGDVQIKNLDRVYQLDELKTTTIKTPGGDLKLWLMDTEPKRAEGMMMLHDNEVKDNEGMIFLFPKVQPKGGNYAFWMHNTILPLDIDYISKEKKVLNIGKGVAMSEAQVLPEGDYFYVIEVKQGKSAKFGLTKGAKVAIPDGLIGLP